jgi:hypothetical protein
MNWYLAKIVFRIICGSGDHAAQFDEQLRLIRAENAALAFIKAQERGMQDEESFYNINDQPVQWKFIGVPELYPFGEMTDGAEMYSRIAEADDAGGYIRNIREKEKHVVKMHAAQEEMIDDR